MARPIGSKDSYKRKSHVAWNKGAKLGPMSVSHKRSISISMNKQSVKDIMSRNTIKMMKRNSFRFLGTFWSGKNQKDIPYRSLYELQALNLLEQISKVVKYEYEALSIPYEDENGLVHNTIPDFLIHYDDATKEIIEVKPAVFLKKNLFRAKTKTQAMKNFAENNNMEFSIWSEKELGITR